MRVFWDIVQGSPAWWEVRKGVPTASGFDRIITPAKGLPSSQADDYAAELASDVAALAPNWLSESERNKPPTRQMQYGQDMEAEARRYYALVHPGQRIRQVGFITTDDGHFGCSPDGLIVDAEDNPIGGLELKVPMPKTHAGYLLRGVLPLEYRCQVHGCLLVTGLPFWSFMSYCPGMEPLVLRIEADDFTVKLAACLEAFFPRYLEIRQKLLGREPGDDHEEVAQPSGEATLG